VTQDERMTALFDLLVASPEGLTWEQIANEMGWDRRATDKTIHDLRMFLGDDDTINLPAERPLDGGKWTYKLTGTFDLTAEWVNNRLQDFSTRLFTMYAMVKSLVKHLDGRTIEGRKAARWERHLRRLIEDLADIDEAS
jgi:hypothetical protein